MLPSVDGRSGPSKLERNGPLVGILALFALLLSVLVFNERVATTTGLGDGGTSLPDEGLPEGVMSWSLAESQGVTDQYDWGEQCDTTLGVYKLPMGYSQECFARFNEANDFLGFDGNGGDTSMGVTGETIKLVVYNPAADPMMTAMMEQFGFLAASPEEFQALADGWIDLFSTYYETYGRRIEIVTVQGSGLDEVAAVADATAIVSDHQPFAVIGGPTNTNAFADTLANQGVVCFYCAPIQPDAWYAERSPFVYEFYMTADQTMLQLAEYIGKRLDGQPAAHAGEDLVNQQRVFGLIQHMSSDEAQGIQDRFLDALGEQGVEIADEAVQTYAEPSEVFVNARVMIAKLKEQGVTSVVLAADGLSLFSILGAADEQNYHPEWILGATQAADYNTTGRFLPQTQWSHAFGITTLPVHGSNEGSAGYRTWEWFYGSAPPVPALVQIYELNYRFVFQGIQGAGPNLTPETFQQALFQPDSYEVTPQRPGSSYGSAKWPAADFGGWDDVTEIWWDADREVADELGNVGPGIFMFSDGGARYALGEWPEGPGRLFDPEGAIDLTNDAQTWEIEPPADWQPLQPS